MNKFLFILSVAIAIATDSTGQSFYRTASGTTSFFSSAPLENIEATNKKVRSALDTETGEILVKLRIEDFEFRKSLMQKHFNENYMESHLYPEASFRGKVSEFQISGLSETPSRFMLEGQLTIHGITRSIKTTVFIKASKNTLECETKFPVLLRDYEVEIPRIFLRNIAEVIDVSVKFNLKEG